MTRAVRASVRSVARKRRAAAKPQASATGAPALAGYGNARDCPGAPPATTIGVWLPEDSAPAGGSARDCATVKGDLPCLPVEEPEEGPQLGNCDFAARGNVSESVERRAPEAALLAPLNDPLS